MQLHCGFFVVGGGDYDQLVYDQGRFCETFHSDDAGWRTCNACKKRVHCGCIASLYSFVHLDAGGVECLTCATKAAPVMPFKNVQHIVPPAPVPMRVVDPGAVRSWGEPFGARGSRNIDVGGAWQPYSSAWYPASSAGFPVVRHVSEVERPLEGNSAEPTIKGLGLAVRSEDAHLENKFAQASADHLRGDSADGEQHAVGSSHLGFSKDLGVDGPDTLQGDWDGDSRRVGLSTSISLGGMPINTGKASADVARVLAGKSLFPTQDLLDAGPSTGLSMSIGSLTGKDAAGGDSSQQGLLGPLSSLTTPGGAGSSGGGAEPRDFGSKLTGLSPYRSRHRQLLPRPHQSGTASPTSNAEVKSSEAAGSVRVARPPGQGRGRNQLLPRYWPRITDQELQQITSGDSNATITPLFEKMLSASDAGRIGRLVLPKACAEAYFPAISQPEGLPMKIQDVTGKEWVFQFRFWPNNNSRMYVLEGVTPCIQSMQLQAGDTVTFSRLDPEGKLVMGYRRAPASLSSQDPKPATKGISANMSKGLSVGSVDGLYAGTTGASLLSASANAEVRNKSGQSDVSDSGYGWSKAEKGMGKEGSILEALSQVDRKQRARPLGGKSKRFRLENEDSLELKNNWEEAQELLRPPPSVVPTVVTIEGHDFEEYEEPPVLTKRTIFTTRQSGEQDQWAQCDECGSWRRVPADALVPTRWTCSDNSWDNKRASCGAPQELSSDDVDHLLGLVPGEEFSVPEKKEAKAGQMAGDTSAGLEALAIAAAMGETGRVSTSPSSPARTTKHPRHRPGCTCIVCIQPPSGKGPKHKQNCLCNVCVTVKRRFKTLMLRRKKRLSEREAEGYVRRKRKDDVEGSSSSKLVTDAGSLADGSSRRESSGGGTVVEGPRRDDGLMADISNSSSLKGFGLSLANTRAGEDALLAKGQIDLNSQPEREEEPTKLSGRISMKQLLHDASLPLDTYLKQQGMTSLFASQAGETSGAAGQGAGTSEKKSDEQSSSQCQDHSNEEASQTSARVQGDSSGAPNQVDPHTQYRTP
ncbi:hypothetical protein R1sor_001554 [Riccia sorocarpa]|uniref:B3 domain-containing transcription repressor VAL2 n=1 Tax=Riccia sorocarpa TaxID=122646 RepID=A0ABD3GYR5_9MARC